MMSNEHEMKFDNLHTLENFLDIYDNPAEMVVTEAIANCLDVNSTKIDIKIEKNQDGKNIISFQDNGPGMNKSIFDDYHVGSRSTKSKGDGIGFAGIGAKVYLAAWDKTQIITETCCGETVLASTMYRDGRNIKWRNITPTHRQQGTVYKVLLKDRDYYHLVGNLEDIVIEIFNNAMLDDLKITINGKQLLPWKPNVEKKKSGIVWVKGRSLPYTFILSSEEIPQKHRSMEFHIKGKKINKRTPDFISDLKYNYQNNVYISVDAISISDYLKTDKTSFKPGFVSGHVYREIDQEILKIVKKFGLLEKQAPPKYTTTPLDRAFDELFKELEFSWLNPDALALKTKSRGPNVSKKRTQSDNRGIDHNQRNNTNKPSQRKGFSIMFLFGGSKKPEGWLDLASNRPAINLEHPLYEKFEKNLMSRNYHITKAVITILIKHGATKKSLSVEEAFELHTKILTKLRDTIWQYN